MPHHAFICADAIGGLRLIPDNTVQSIITSPPYWGLRNYHVDGQLGQEGTPEEYVENLVKAFREAKRVLRDDGTLWLVMGDCYAGAGDRRGGKGDERGQAKKRKTPDRGIGLKAKDLIGIPWLVAFALRADGWYLRLDVVWEKTNAMPESVRDRPTKAHEYVFLLSKSSRYFYDKTAIQEPYSTKSNPQEVYAGIARKKYDQQGAQNPSDTKRRVLESMRNGRGRNKRSVWRVSTQPFPGAHFATFPPKLVKPMILASTSEYGCCSQCGAPYVREVVRTGHVNRRESAHVPGNCSTKTDSTGWALTTVATDSWIPSCDCDAAFDDLVPCIVLDPFGGAGTVSMVAKELKRDSIYIDIKREYLDMAINRCAFSPSTCDDYIVFPDNSDLLLPCQEMQKGVVTFE